MQTGTNTTTILLQRGVEDVALLEELRAISCSCSLWNRETFMAIFHTITALRQALNREISQMESEGRPL